MANTRTSDPWASTSGMTVASPTQPPSSDPWSKVAFTNSGAIGGNKSTPSGDPWSNVYSGSKPPVALSPQNGQVPQEQSADYWDESKDVFSNIANSFVNRVGDVWHDSNSSFLGKLWDTANVPIISGDEMERFAHWMGQDGDIPGWERGLFSLASGFTSPLQLGLTFGTFGTSALESGGAALLSKAGMGAEEIATVAKGLPEYLKGLSLGRYGEEIASPLAKMGVDYNTVKRGYDILENAGMHADSLLQNHVVRRVASSMIRGAMEDTSQAIVTGEKWARAMQVGVDLGFTAPMVAGLVVTTPRALDALKEGDYDKFGELAVETLGGAAFAGLGLLALKNEAGGLMNDLRAKSGFGVKPSEEYNQVVRYSGIFDKDNAVAEQAKADYVRDFRTKNPDMPEENLFRALNFMQAGLDEKLMTERYNWLVQAMDKPELMIKAGQEAAAAVPASSGLHEAFAIKHPETEKGLISSFLAASTPGKTPEEAVRFADEMLGSYKQGGRIAVPDTENGNFKSIARRYALENLQKVIDHVGGDEKKAVEWLTTEHPIDEVRAVKGRGRINSNGNGHVMGAMALGDTVGKRFLDLHNGVNGHEFAAAAQSHFSPKPRVAPKYEVNVSAEAPLDLSGDGGASHFLRLDDGDNLKAFAVLTGRPNVLKGGVELSATRAEERGKGYGPRLYQEAAQYAKKQGAVALLSDVDANGHLSSDAKARWKKLAKQNPNVKYSEKAKRFYWDLRKETFAKPESVPATQYHGGEWRVTNDANQPSRDRVEKEVNGINDKPNRIENDIAHSLKNSLINLYEHMKHGNSFTKSLEFDDVQNAKEIGRLFGLDLNLEPAVKDAPEVQSKPLHPLRSKEIGGIKQIAPEKFLEYIGEQAPLSEADFAEVAKLAQKYKQDAGLQNSIDPIRVSFGTESGDITGYSFQDRIKAMAAMQAGVKEIPVMTDLFDPSGKYVPSQPINVDAVKADREMSIARLKELADSRSLKGKSEEYKQQLIRAFDPRLMTDELRQLAKQQHDYFSETLEMAQAGGALDHGIEWYAPQFWKDMDRDNPLVKRMEHDARSGSFAVNTTMARHRMFQSAFEGLMLGKELEHTDLVALAAHNRAEFQKVIAARNFIERLRASGARTSEGRPIVAPEGMARLVEGANGENPAIMLDPRRVPDIRIANKVIEGLRSSGKLKNMIDDGTITVHNEELTAENLTKRMEQLRNNYLNNYKDVNPRPGSKQGEAIRRMQDQYAMMKAVRDAGTPEAQAEALKAFNEKYKPTYLWSTHDYRVIDVPAMKNWRWMLTDPMGQTVLAHTNMRVHPELYDYLNRRLGGEKPWKNPVAKGLLKATTEAKGILLSIDTFHFFQEALRGLMSGISPTLYKPDLRTNPMLRMGIEEGLTVYSETRDLQQFQDALEGHGHSKVMRKVPGLGKLIDGFQSFLFQKYIPGLKARAFESMFDRYKAQYPELSTREIARMTAADVNNRFGGQNYARMGRSLNTMNLTRIFALAPDWIESEMRAWASVFSPNGKVVRRDMALSVLGMWGVARVLNYMATGDGHYEAPFALAVKSDDGKEKLYSIRSLPTDAFHLISDPKGFMAGRRSPLLRSSLQMFEGTDEWGRALPQHGMFFNLTSSLAKQVAPIAVQSGLKQALGEQPTGSTPLDAAYKMLGGSTMPYRTEAQKLATEKASMMSSSGPIDPQHLRVHQMMLKLEDDIRSGNTPLTELNTLVENGQLSVKDAKDIQKNVTQTKTMDPDMARLVARASRLPLPDLLEVWDAATPSEREALTKTLISKKNSYVKRSLTDMTPEARKTDPVLRRIKSMFPNQLMF